MLPKSDEKKCHCGRNQCKKLYCYCLSVGASCTSQCSCVDCHNRKGAIRERLPLRKNRGCSCQKSFCVKKYCECYQEGMLCNHNCKCIDCQNSETSGNQRIVSQINSMTPSQLYPIVLSSSQADLEQSLEMSDAWLHSAVQSIINTAKAGDVVAVANTFIDILKQYQMGQNNHTPSIIYPTIKREESQEIMEQE